MSEPSDNETWIMDEGDSIIQKKVSAGIDGLSLLERLVYCIWVADYGMRNAGDLDTANDVYANFQQEAARLARELHLLFTLASFSLSKEALQHEYFERFDRICEEVKGNRG